MKFNYSESSWFSEPSVSYGAKKEIESKEEESERDLKDVVKESSADSDLHLKTPDRFFRLLVRSELGARCRATSSPRRDSVLCESTRHACTVLAHARHTRRCKLNTLPFGERERDYTVALYFVIARAQSDAH